MMNSTHSAQKIVIISLICICGGIAVHAQNRDSDIKYRLAQSYERSGDFESAVKILEQLVASDSTNPAFVDVLRRDYLQIKQYDKAIDLTERILRRTPNDIDLIAQLGVTYYLKSDEPKAVETWERALAVDPKNEFGYRSVTSAIMQCRLFDRAINVYLRGRAALGNPNLFTADVAYLYSVILKYTDATKEYVNLVRQNPTQLGFVQIRLAAYTGQADGLEAAILVVERAVKDDPGVIGVQQLLSWLYMEGKRYDRAYEVYKLLDERTGAQGHELFSFADHALKERAYTVSAKAFQDIITKYPAFDQLALVKFGYARTLEESDAQSDTMKLFGLKNPFVSNGKPESESKPLFTGAIAAYNRVIVEFPNSEIAARALLRIAIIKQEKFFDLDGARASLETLVKNYKLFAPVTQEATLRLGDVLLAQGNLREAELQYTAVAGNGLRLNALQEQAAFRSAELDYFQSRFQESLTKLKDIGKNANSDATNDALDLQIFIQESMESDQAALKEFAKADLLKRQQKLSEALAVFQSIMQSYPKSGLVDETLINIGDVQTQMGKFADAVVSYDLLLKDFPESISLDRTLMKIGQVFQLGLKDSTQAIATYKKILEQYPTSIYISEARKKIRELRGDSI
jgi:tetratricopeptide (TPR) repeat protein